ncbi:hypothetical protein [Rhizobium sp. LC145]|uniref:hypothetical protein n=1 Tax=Rhizobium sp. LC145 TaxID=1120688 RepID=UPI000A737392|nr:hypothetical protein [Rhizobium sp. LC145]
MSFTAASAIAMGSAHHPEIVAETNREHINLCREINCFDRSRGPGPAKLQASNGVVVL